MEANNNNIKTKVLWIDDDIKRSFLRAYVDEFQEQGYIIVPVDNPDQLQSALYENYQELCVIILDVLMPTGNTIDFEKADGGIKTGYIILDKLLDDKNLTDTLFVVFSIVDNNDVRKNYRDNKKVFFLKKSDFFYDTFVAEIQKLIKRFKESLNT